MSAERIISGAFMIDLTVWLENEFPSVAPSLRYSIADGVASGMPPDAIVVANVIRFNKVSGFTQASLVFL